MLLQNELQKKNLNFEYIVFGIIKTISLTGTSSN